MTDPVLLEREDSIISLKLNRPETMNALDAEVQDALAEKVESVADDPEVRIVIITGRGKAFCAGGDIKNMMRSMESAAPVEIRTMIKTHQRWVSRLMTMEKPVISAVNGYAVGAGLSLAMAGDIIIAAESAKFGQAFVRVGVVPDLAGMYLLPRLVGLNKAKELTFTGDYLSAREAAGIGLVNMVVPDDRFNDQVYGFARKLAQGPTKAIGMAKVILNRSFETDLVQFLEIEAAIQSVCMTADSFKEGVRAFIEKRPPVFKD